MQWKMPEWNPSKARRVGGYAALFFASLVFFFYMTFPYEVVKESIASELTKATGLSVQIGELSPLLPLGLGVGDVSVQSPGKVPFRLQSIRARVGILPMLIGRVSVGVTLRAPDGGSLYAKVSVKLFRLLFGGKGGSPVASISYVGLDARQFNMAPVAEFLMGVLASGDKMSPMVAPLVEKVVFTGKLDSNVDLYLDLNNINATSGVVELTFNNAALRMSDPTLGLPDQVFQRAAIKASIQQGVLNFDDKSGLIASDIELSIRGKAQLRPMIETSTLDLALGVRLDKMLKDQFGFIVDAISGNPSGGGAMNMKIQGALFAPSLSYL
jgi:type II secretion system protein N